MKILYGVVGEGMGHATRSRVVLDHLLARGHEVHIVASGRAKEFLQTRFPHVHGIWGYTIAYEANEVRNWQTLLQNVRGAVAGWPKNVRMYFEILESFSPDVVVSDFETFTWMFAKNQFLPVISLDNIQMINRCKHDPEVLAGFETEFQLARAITKSKLPGAFHYLITTFFRPPVRKERTTLIPSVLRPEILSAKREKGEHLLVYQTSTTNDALISALRQSGRPVRIYGVRRGIKTDEVEGNLTFKPFSEEGFIDDLRTCRAVVAGGGFTLMSEAVYLHKPMLSIPVGGQFEQVLNARYLEKAGYGQYAQLFSPAALDAFLGRLPQCEAALANYQQDGNEEMKKQLDLQLARAVELRGRWDEQTST